MQIIDGKKISQEILAKIKREVALLPFQPVFSDVLVGGDPSSIQYVKMKAKAAESVGIKFHKANFPDSITTPELVKEINVLNKIPNMCGIIVQLPLPVHLNIREVLDAIDPSLDVDCLGIVASEKFYSGSTAGGTAGGIGFPTALACMAIIDYLINSLNINLAHKKIVVLGQGQLVGKPVTALLAFRGLTPTTITRKTANKEQLLKEADVIISGIGQGKYITGDMIKEGAVLIDAGTSESLGHSPTGEPNGGIVGDVDLESVKDAASYVSPVPGGVGPVTVAMLLNNVLRVAKDLK